MASASFGGGDRKGGKESVANSDISKGKGRSGASNDTTEEGFSKQEKAHELLGRHQSIHTLFCTLHVSTAILFLLLFILLKYRIVT
jgi:hypothetical protein